MASLHLFYYRGPAVARGKLSIGRVAGLHRKSIKGFVPAAFYWPRAPSSTIHPSIYSVYRRPHEG